MADRERPASRRSGRPPRPPTMNDTQQNVPNQGLVSGTLEHIFGPGGTFERIFGPRGSLAAQDGFSHGQPGTMNASGQPQGQMGAYQQQPLLHQGDAGFQQQRISSLRGHMDSPRMQSPFYQGYMGSRPQQTPGIADQQRQKMLNQMQDPQREMVNSYSSQNKAQSSNVSPHYAQLQASDSPAFGAANQQQVSFTPGGAYPSGIPGNFHQSPASFAQPYSYELPRHNSGAPTGYSSDTGKSSANSMSHVSPYNQNPVRPSMPSSTSPAPFGPPGAAVWTTRPSATTDLPVNNSDYVPTYRSYRELPPGHIPYRPQSDVTLPSLGDRLTNSRLWNEGQASFAPRGGTPRNNSQRCDLCLEVYQADEAKAKFPYSCKRAGCPVRFCIDCIKDWFIDACKNESKMPPKCCMVIPLSTVAGLLTTAQVERFKAKFEEWSTPDRIYCPLLACSAFIPPRLYIQPIKAARSPPSMGVNFGIPQTHTSRPSPQATADFRRRSSTISAPVAMKSSVACPECTTVICTKCRSFVHLNECPTSDIDPGLEEQLKKWKIKRCPKCRTGLRKVFGCSHVQCRCGAHFCFECLLPISECDGRCEEDDNEEEPEGPLAEDDLDGRAGFTEGDGHEFGEEPQISGTGSWGCAHVWQLAREGPTPGSISMPSTADPRLGDENTPANRLECHRCFRDLRILTEQEEDASRSPDGDVEMGGVPREPWPLNVDLEPAWQCFKRHMVCYLCPKLAPENRLLDASWKWSCNCDKECFVCDRDEAIALKASEDAVAWICRCGMFLCQVCKNFVQEDSDSDLETWGNYDWSDGPRYYDDEAPVGRA